MFGVMRLSDQLSFIRSIRVRYLSGLLILAVTCGVIMFMMNRANSFRHEVDGVASGFADLARDLRQAEAFAGQATSNWRADTSKELASAALGHVERLTLAIEQLDDRIASIRPSVSKAAERRLQSASVNGDLFWSARDIVRNLGVFASTETVDASTYREISNQVDFFAQPMLRARAMHSKPNAAPPKQRPTGCLPGRAWRCWPCWPALRSGCSGRWKRR